MTMVTGIALISFVWTTLLIVLYARSVFKKEIKPHLFSWLIWGILSAIAAGAQFVSQAGLGAWTTVYNAVFNLTIAVLALRFGEKHITKSDWVFLLTSLSALPVWQWTRNPFYAVLIVTLINGMGFMPTYRKSFFEPFQESLLVFSLAVPGSLWMLFSVETYSLTTLLYPAGMAFFNLLLVLLLVVRRHQLKRAVV